MYPALLVALLSVLLLSVAPSVARAEPMAEVMTEEVMTEEALRPYTARYLALNGKRKAKMNIQLVREAEDIYAHKMELKIFIVGTVRQLTMMRKEGEGLRPLYASGGLGKRVESYEWQDGEMTFTDRKGKQRTLASDDGEDDENSMQYEIGLRLAQIGVRDRQALDQWRMEYKMTFDRGRSWSRVQMQVRDIGPVSTSMGEIECVKVVGESDDGYWQIELDLAPSLHWLPVSYIRQKMDGEGRRGIELLSVEFANPAEDSQEG